MLHHLWPSGYDGTVRPEPGCPINPDSEQAENLYACWPLWEGAGIGVQDVIRGTPSAAGNVFTWQADREIGPVAAFSGSVQFINLATPGVTTLVRGSAYTVSVWALSTNPSSPVRQDVVGDNAGGGGGLGVNIGFGTGAATGNIGAMQSTSGGASTNLDSGIAAVANTWYHIAATWDGTTGADARKIYVNGVFAASGAGTANLGGTTLGIARAGTNNSSFLAGRVFDLRVYRGVKSAGQVAALFDPATRFDLWRPPRIGMKGMMLMGGGPSIAPLATVLYRKRRAG